MAAIINTNAASLNAQRNLNASQGALSTSLQRLSSGLRINSAKDDAAGLAISERFTSQIKGLNQAVRNANDGISLAQTAEGGLGTSGDLLQRMRELAVQSANGTNSASDRASLQQEVSQLKQELDRVATTTQFNGQSLLDGTLSATQFQVGANANQTINIGIASAKGGDLGNYGFKTVNGTKASSEATAAANSAAANNVAAQTLTLAGNGQTAQVTLAGGESAAKIATMVNTNTATTGVTAEAKTQAQLSGVAVGNVTFKLSGSNTSPISIGATVTSGSDLSSIAAAINAQTSATGITATADNTGKLTLTSNAGDDIKIEDYTNSAASNSQATVTGLDPYASTTTTSGASVTLTTGGSDSTSVGGQLKFSSNNGYTISSTGGTNGGLFNVAAGTQNASTITSISKLDISTVSGANDALSTIDAALTSINNSRAALGAIQNRFASTISNLSTTAENLSSARSRIQDADFASETASLTRGQILQQAGTAMLAQANSLPNGVLALLRG
ncbi:MAG TPA: flagellin [Noviherbaspirillum sp.]|nr:flagellin [Noviherbaspirillum sp.]